VSLDNLELPDVKAVSAAVEAWASDSPEFARLLAAGMEAKQALARWGWQLLKADQATKAVAVFRAAVALAPADPALWANLGFAFDRAGLFGEAAACLERSLALSPAQPDLWLLLGILRKKQNDPDRAEAAYRAALEQEPASAMAWQCLGLIKEERRDYAGAIDCLTACLKHGEATAALQANLGKLCYQTGRFFEACTAFGEAVRLDSVNPHYRLMLGKAHFLLDVIQGDAVEAALARYRDCAGSPAGDKELVELFNPAFALLASFGHAEAATRIGGKRLELWPTSPSANYLLGALVGRPGLDRSPAEYVVEHFDAFAEGFDAQLAGVLRYDIPEKIRAALQTVVTPGRLYDVLDAGCGTGLCGPLLRGLARGLTGVDLSPKMLEVAGRRGIYDHLVREDLIAFLEHSPGGFDLLVAADVMIYLGDLAPFFAAASAAVRPGGLIAFSTERLEDGGYRLLSSGRFAQAPEYVRRLAEPHFQERICSDTTIRLEAAGRVPGNVFVFQRRS
jgi:predicted TPR repeat methyltransferase